jgi:hypothetical protein
MRAALLICFGTLAFAPSAFAGATAGDGLTADADMMSWPRWQGRLLLSTAAPDWQRVAPTLDATGLKISLMGDYYFGSSAFRRDGSGGFRATSGLLLGARSGLLSGQAPGSAEGLAFSVDRRTSTSVSPLPMAAAGDTAALPYFGVGYSGASLRGGWSFNADLGLIALAPGNAVKLGRVFSGTQNLDDLLRDLRLAPVLQLGVSYSF